MTAANALPVCTMLVDDLADRFAMAEEVGFVRAPHVAGVSDAERWKMITAYRQSHETRTRLYAAQIKATDGKRDLTSP